MKTRDASVKIKETWEVVEDMEFNRLNKLSLPNVGEPVDLYECIGILSLAISLVHCGLCVVQDEVRVDGVLQQDVRPRDDEEREKVGAHQPNIPQSHHDRRPHHPSRTLSVPTPSSPALRVLLTSRLFEQLAKTQGNVFATDAILATLMCCCRSLYSWDIVVQKVGKKIFFDKREDSDFG